MIVTLDALDNASLKLILTAPKNALVKQYQKLLAFDGVELEFSDDALEAITEIALARKTGARGLRAIIETAMMDIMFDVPTIDNVQKCIITRETITDGAGPALLYKNAAKKKSPAKKNGGAVPANSLAPDENLKSDKLNNYSYDPEKARELLKEAGWDGTATLKCVYYYTDQATVDLMSAIQAYLADVGITFKAELVEGDLASILWTAPADQTNGPSAVDWDICYAASAALSLHEYYDRYRTGSATNSHTPEDPELNALIDATSASADVNVQNEAFRALIEYENEDLFCMALYYQPIFLITSDRISGMKVGTPQYCIDWDIQNWIVS